MKQNLNEQISRIKELLSLNESLVVNETSAIELNEQWAQFVKTFVPALERKIITSLEGKLGKKIAQATDAEIATALKSAELTVLRKEIAAAVYASEKTMIDDVFSKYNMSIPGDASKAYAELQTKGLNRSILRDVASEWKAGGGKVASGGSSAAAPAASSTPAPTSFTIPQIEAQLSSVNLLDREAVLARLKNLFPKAPSSDLTRIVNNLEKAELRTQMEFDKAYTEAVAGYGPQYQKVLKDPGTYAKAKNVYDGLGKWQKRIFWAVLIVGGYKALKAVGVPVDKATGWLLKGMADMVKDQAAGVKDEFSGGGTGNSAGTTYSFDDSGILEWLSKEYPATPKDQYILRKTNDGYGVKVKTGGDGKEYMFKFENGTYKQQ